MPAHSRSKNGAASLAYVAVIPIDEAPCSHLVMPGLVPGIHDFLLKLANKTWMAGTSPAMTKKEEPWLSSFEARRHAAADVAPRNDRHYQTLLMLNSIADASQLP